MDMFAALGAMLAALVMLAVQVPGLIKALRTGVLVSRSYGSPKIERATQEARFWRLWKQRAAALLLPVGLFLGGAAYFGLGLSVIASSQAERQAPPGGPPLSAPAS